MTVALPGLLYHVYGFIYSISTACHCFYNSKSGHNISYVRVSEDSDQPAHPCSLIGAITGQYVGN